VPDDLETLAIGLARRPPGSFAPRSILFGKGSVWGIGLRSDAEIPSQGCIRLVHWIVSPYESTPTGGIVEDCISSRLEFVFGYLPDILRIYVFDRADILPESRFRQRNYAVSNKILGLRGWDIPHDRHAAVSDLWDGHADVTGRSLPGFWHSSWDLAAIVDRQWIQIAVRSGDAVHVRCTEGGRSPCTESGLRSR